MGWLCEALEGAGMEYYGTQPDPPWRAPCSGPPAARLAAGPPSGGDTAQPRCAPRARLGVVKAAGISNGRGRGYISWSRQPGFRQPESSRNAAALARGWGWAWLQVFPMIAAAGIPSVTAAGVSLRTAGVVAKADAGAQAPDPPELAPDHVD
jgi:hypothetical protein